MKQDYLPNNLHDKFRLIRGVVEHEDNLINHRFSWLIVAQSFLLASCVAKGSYPWPVVFAGIGSIVFTYISILAATRALGKLKENTQDEFEGYYSHLMSTGKRHTCGLIAAYVAPLVFLVVWLIEGVRIIWR